MREYERDIHTEFRIGYPTVVRGADLVIVIQEAECRGGKANHDRRWSERARGEGESGDWSGRAKVACVDFALTLRHSQARHVAACSHCLL